MAKQKKPDTLFDLCRASLERMQKFDVQTMPRKDHLGEELNFQDAVAPAKRLIDFYQQLSTSILEDLPDPQLQKIQSQADGDYNHFKTILDFSATQSDAGNARTAAINAVVAAYDPAFNKLYQYIAYSASKATDWQALDRKARETIQGIDDRADKLVKKLDEVNTKAADILDEIRKTAAEQGVSQQASYYKEEAEAHATAADTWFKQGVIPAAIVVAVWAIVSLFLHNIPGLNPDTGAVSFQIAVSKVLVFAVISFMLFLCSRNFLSHKHNAIVNKHRQNALMTYRALVNAAEGHATGDLVLNQAAICIFSPQSTGYAKDVTPDGATAKSVVEMLGKPLTDSTGN